MNTSVPSNCFNEIILVVASVRRERPGVDVKNAIRQFANEINIVTDEYERPFKLLQRDNIGSRQRKA